MVVSCTDDDPAGSAAPLSLGADRRDVAVWMGECAVVSGAGDCTCADLSLSLLDILDGTESTGADGAASTATGRAFTDARHSLSPAAVESVVPSWDGCLVALCDDLRAGTLAESVTGNGTSGAAWAAGSLTADRRREKADSIATVGGSTVLTGSGGWGEGWRAADC